MRESPWRDRVPSVHSSREEAGSKNAGALIEETGATPADYLFGPGIDEPLAMSRSGGQVYYYDVDGLESANLVTNSSGAVQDSYVYDAWGQTRRQTGTLANPFGYTAREFGEAGTLFYRARYYSPGVGRFLNEDPLGSWVAPRAMADPGGPPVRDYVYASSRPAWKKDAYGLIDCEKACAGQPFPTRPCGAGCSRYYLCQLCNAAEASSTGELAAIAKIAQGAVEDGAIAVALGHTKDLPSELKLLGQFSQAALMRDLNGCLDYCSLCPNHDCPAPIPQGELGKK